LRHVSEHEQKFSISPNQHINLKPS
jgi:hypothetical protein